MAGGFDDPGTWELRHAGVAPLVDGNREGFLRRLFGQVEIADQPDESGDDAAPVGAIDGVNGRVGIHGAGIRRHP
jgi:hypothetical protein